MPRGGARPGAGRKKKDRTPVGIFATAEEYLDAVVKGTITPDSLRIAAAKALIQYQKAKQRAPVQNPSPSKLRAKTAKDIEKSVLSEFEEKAAKIHEKFQKRKG